MRCLAEKKFFFVKCLQREFNNWFETLDFEGWYSLYNQYNINLAFGGEKKTKNTICFKGFILWMKKSKHCKFSNVSQQ